MFMQRLRKDRKGMTLIELVCAVAILGIITLTVGGAMVFATNSYRHSTVETALQQEAQFTVNSIESLIIDATDTVTFSGDVLTIKNVDYTYEIVYDGTEKKLTYTQYSTSDSSIIVADNELLAEHVSRFFVDASNFDTSRNVQIQIEMENSGSEFSSYYNITSRNDASAGDPVEIVANIVCETEIILEPLQTYTLGVSVVGPSNTAYTCHFESEPGMSGATTANVVSGGIDITIGANETGGDDAMLRLIISTVAVDSSGNPFTKQVNVKIRRINEVGLGALSLKSGDSLKNGAVYGLSAEALGTNLAEVPGTAYDSDYVNPDTIRWSIRVSNGDAGSDWATITPSTVDEKTVEFTLARDIPAGVSVFIRATALHPEGVLRGSAWTNKTSAKNNAIAKYGTVYKEYELKKNSPYGDDVLRRGDECYLSAGHNYADLVKEDWMRNHPGETWDPRNGYNGGYEGNTHYRFVCEDRHTSGGTLTHTCSWYYTGWHKIADQGDDPTRVKFNSTDFDGMLYMEDYDLDLYFSFYYIDFNNVKHVYPSDFDANDTNPDPRNVFTVPVNKMEIIFDKGKDSTGTLLNLTPYLTASASGIGSRNNPLPLTQGFNIQFNYVNIGGCSNDREAIGKVFSNMKIYRADNNQYVTEKNFQNNFNGDKKSGVVSFETQNGGLQKDVVYKMVMSNVYTSTTGTEVYSEDNTSGASGRGLIYFILR